MASFSLAEQAASQQLAAYNARDIDSFLACYADDVELCHLTTGEVFCKGTFEMRAIYGAMFNRCPDLHCTLVKRIVCGNIAIDEEHVTGQMPGKVVHATAIYEVNDAGLIIKAWFVRGQ
ncbi:MAG: nuclear transport factor 2 family protein [Bacteroidota bacterium]